MGILGCGYPNEGGSGGEGLVSCLQVTCICRKGEQLHPSKQTLMFDGVNRKKNPGLTGPSSSPAGSLTAHYNHETKDWDQSLLACCAQPCLCKLSSFPLYPFLDRW